MELLVKCAQCGGKKYIGNLSIAVTVAANADFASRYYLSIILYFQPDVGYDILNGSFLLQVRP